MSLHGTIDTMSVDELVGWIRTRQHSGILKFKRGQRIKTLNVEAGRVANAASNDPREYFGQFLINFGLISEDQLQKAFETQQETRVLLGRILVMTGLLTEEQVLQILELKIRETVLDVYLWPDGAFEFHDGLLSDDPSVVPVAVDLEQLNTEGLRRRAHHTEIRRLIPDNRCTFKPLPSQQPSPEPGSSTSVILDLAGQGYSAADIILRFHSVDFPILHSLCDLVSRGFLQVACGRPAPVRTGCRPGPARSHQVRPASAKRAPMSASGRGPMCEITSAAAITPIFPQVAMSRPADRP